MLKNISIAIGFALVLTGVWIAPQNVVHVASAAPTGIASTVVAAIPPPAPPPVEKSNEPEGLGKLAGYTLEAMLSWRKPPIGAPMAAYARDIAWVSLEQPALWENDTNRSRTAILLATLAFFEGAFLPYVDSGDCNSKKWRDNAYSKGITWSRAICDQGFAYSLWQIHPEGGIEITPDGEAHYKFGALQGKDMIADRRVAARVALAMVRKSIRLTHGLVGYTGESDGSEKASLRWRFAESYWRKHKFE